MATLAALVDRLRLELGDHGQGFQASVLADGATTRYDLPVVLVEPTGLVVYLASAPGSPIALNTGYTMDYRNGAITMAVPPASGEVVVIEGTHYETFLTADLETFLNTAFLQHTRGRVDEYGDAMELADLPPVEDYLLVLLAETEALWAMATDAAQEIDVRSPDGVNIPVGQYYEQIMGLLAAKKRSYDELASALGVGLNRMEVFTLRRISRATNRYVPIYVPQEYDDRNPPTRVYPPIDPQVL